jgi:hypothetical protein
MRRCRGGRAVDPAFAREFQHAQPATDKSPNRVAVEAPVSSALLIDALTCARDLATRG